jgi:hypothetical protein
MYNDVENEVTGAIKDVVVAGAGDPHITDQQAAAASWSQDAAGVTGAHTQGGDMSWQQAGQAAERQWEGVGQTALNTPEGLPIKELLDGGK